MNVGMTVSDLLQESACAFSRLLKYSVEIQFNAKGAVQTLLLTFAKDHFKHLSGLHKCRDISLPTKAEILFHHALTGKVKHEDIMRSKFYAASDLEGRLLAIRDLETSLKEATCLYTFNKRTHIQNFGDTQIFADYFFKFEYAEDNENSVPFYFYFFRNDETRKDNIQSLCSVSIFRGKKNRDFTYRQKRYTIQRINFIEH